jgi:hypothetical protein
MCARVCVCLCVCVCSDPNQAVCRVGVARVQARLRALLQHLGARDPRTALGVTQVRVSYHTKFGVSLWQDLGRNQEVVHVASRTPGVR